MAEPGDDSLTEDVWASPSRKKTPPADAPADEAANEPKTPPGGPQRSQTPTYDHEAVLRKELEGVRSVNEAIEGVIGTLERAQGNMNVRYLNASGTLNSASMAADSAGL
jgi:hypothetical protein